MRMDIFLSLNRPTFVARTGTSLYLSCLIVDFSLQIGSGSCRVIAVATQYFFLASFSWMLTMAFDVWRTLRLATSELRVSAGKQWRKFALYSSWTWMAPFIFVVAAVVTDCAPAGAHGSAFCLVQAPNK